MNEQTRLETCPFCGGEANLKESSFGHSGNGEFCASYRVGCDSCKVYFQRESKFRLVNGYPVFSINGYEEVISLWNHRVNRGAG